ncbi:hypothetical protein NF700_12640 [Sphingomonadaceae bacterium OTU29MARTA1]|nr:hypothetical protein NF700_12640 [Sphingomonadaceae bacterium OTU29MARTA1]
MENWVLFMATLTLVPAFLSSSGPEKEDRVELAVPVATAFGSDGKPRFRAEQAFLLRLASNPEGRVVQYDAAHRMVRISTLQADALWLRCSELKPMRLACGETEATRTFPRYRTRGGSTVDVAASGIVPLCPGDPRCPS